MNPHGVPVAMRRNGALGNVNHVLADVWREAGRHIELESVVTVIARRMAGHGLFLAVAVLIPGKKGTVREVISRAIHARSKLAELGAMIDRAAILGGRCRLDITTAMRQHIERALIATRGRIEGRRGAAALLDINPHTLRARMRKLGIEANLYRDEPR